MCTGIVKILHYWTFVCNVVFFICLQDRIKDRIYGTVKGILYYNIIRIKRYFNMISYS